MVKKLFKHEILAQLRLWLPMQFVLLGVAIFGRIVQLFENETSAYNIVFGSSIIIYCLALAVGLLLTFIFGIVRFYKNLFSHEGYLSFTLPVTAEQHIAVKAVVAVGATVGNLLVAFISFMFFTAGEVFAEVMKAGAYLIKRFIEKFGAGNFALYLIEAVVLLLVLLLASFLLYYACVALGQTFKKNRVMGAVVVYFIYYAITQVIGTIFVIIGQILVNTAFYDWLLRFVNNHSEEFIHIVLCGMILMMAVLSVVYYFVIRFVIRKKLNLE